LRIRVDRDRARRKQVETGGLRRALAGGVEMMSRVPFMGDQAGYYADAVSRGARYIPVCWRPTGWPNPKAHPG
jgi:acetyl-CoA C-acetyltransferase/acetyl-CoA acyltransferase